MVHLVTLKPILLGGLAARVVGVPAVVSAVSGLGYVFVSRGLRGKVLRALVGTLFRFAFGHSNQRIIFQNREDARIVLELTGLEKDKAVLVPGSGVDLSAYAVCPEPEGVPVVTMCSRLLQDKGVAEFVEACRILKGKGVSAEFWLVGEPDAENPRSISADLLSQWKAEGHLKLLGFRSDIADIFVDSHVVVLPSYYGEGLPKVLIEAAACGRAVVTTDHPGCRDAIEVNKTGLLVPIKDPQALAEAIEWVLNHEAERREMGRKARIRAESLFSIESVVGEHLSVYQDLNEAKRIP